MSLLQQFPPSPDLLARMSPDDIASLRKSISQEEKRRTSSVFSQFVIGDSLSWTQGTETRKGRVVRVNRASLRVRSGEDEYRLRNINRLRPRPVLKKYDLRSRTPSSSQPPVSTAVEVHDGSLTVSNIVPKESKQTPPAPDQPCCVCLDQPKTTAIIPCGHRCVCLLCGERLRVRPVASQRRCPVCREPIADLITIFL